jgi:chromosome segregation protein
VELTERETSIGEGLADLRAQASAAGAELAAIETQITQLDDGELVEQLSARRAELALTRQRQASQDGALRGYRQTLKQTSDQLAGRLRRVDELAKRLVDTDSRVEDLRRRTSVLAGEIQQLSERIDPAEAELAALSSRQNQSEKEERKIQVRLQALESRYSHAQLDVARQEDALASLRRQIEDDLGLVDLDLGDDLSGQPLLPLKPLVSSLPEVDVLPEGLEEQVHALKRRLQRMGPVNPNAVQEHREVQQRHEFLSTQAQDLEQATAQLKTVIAELDEVMKREFRTTFNAVAREFKAQFRELFNGGTAHLELTDPDDLLNAGIDIVARPPGKRQQGLALLSGGERALTATALIFAILTVSPTPFCVLDEVDAALDEANVGRFRKMLKSLSEKTQFVIITHNRYTIEAADIVYGISMRPDSTSCVISHRMDQEDE